MEVVRSIGERFMNSVEQKALFEGADQMMTRYGDAINRIYPLKREVVDLLSGSIDNFLIVRGRISEVSLSRLIKNVEYYKGLGKEDASSADNIPTQLGISAFLKSSRFSLTPEHVPFMQALWSDNKNIPTTDWFVDPPKTDKKKLGFYDLDHKGVDWYSLQDMKPRRGIGLNHLNAFGRLLIVPKNSCGVDYYDAVHREVAMGLMALSKKYPVETVGIRLEALGRAWIERERDNMSYQGVGSVEDALMPGFNTDSGKEDVARFANRNLYHFHTSYLSDPDIPKLIDDPRGVALLAAGRILGVDDMQRGKSIPQKTAIPPVFEKFLETIDWKGI